MGGHVQCKRVLTSVNTMTNEIANNDPSKYVRWPDIFGIVQCQIVSEDNILQTFLSRH
jgi:hypothetical protein